MLATLCRPNSKNEKEGLKLSLIGRLKSTKKDLDRSVTARSKGTLAFVFNKALWGGGGRGLKDAGRRLQSGLRRFGSFDSRLRRSLTMTG